MPLFVDRKKTYTREVKDHEDGEGYTVELRKMTEGHRQQRNDLMYKSQAESNGSRRGGKKRKVREEDFSTSMLIGKVRLFDLKKSIVRWNFKDEDGNNVPVSDENIASLDPSIAEQIWDHVEELNPYIFNQGEEDEEDDDIEDSEDDEPAYPHAVDDEPAENFAEGEGPTGRAATN